jgi:hypothetical protein
MATQPTVTSLTANQLKSLFGDNATPAAIIAFQKVFEFVNKISSKAVVGASTNASPVNPGDLSFTIVSNTQLKLQFMGTDNVVRSTTLTLS